MLSMPLAALQYEGMNLKLGLQRRAKGIPLGELNVIELEDLKNSEGRISGSSQVGMNDWHRRCCSRQE